MERVGNLKSRTGCSRGTLRKILRAAGVEAEQTARSRVKIGARRRSKRPDRTAVESRHGGIGTVSMGGPPEAVKVPERGGCHTASGADSSAQLYQGNKRPRQAKIRGLVISTRAPRCWSDQ